MFESRARSASVLLRPVREDHLRAVHAEAPRALEPLRELRVLRVDDVEAPPERAREPGRKRDLLERVVRHEPHAPRPRGAARVMRREAAVPRRTQGITRS